MVDIWVLFKQWLAWAIPDALKDFTLRQLVLLGVYLQLFMLVFNLGSLIDSPTVQEDLILDMILSRIFLEY